MRVLGIIPARSGSKGIVDKNISMINNKRLIDFTLESAGKSNLDEIFLSTDSEHYRSLLGTKTRIHCPILRPASLASDKALTIDVVKHVIEYYSNNSQYFDAIVLLQPTCPMRSVELINESIDILNADQNVDSVVTVANVGGLHPFRMKRIVGDRLVNFIEQGFEDMRPRQVLPEVFIRTGSIYAIRTDKLLLKNSLVGDSVYPIVEKNSDYINIDTPEDLSLFRSRFET